MRELMSKLSVTELQLKAAEEDRDTLRSDLENSEAGRDVLIKKAWETRDNAVKRKNASEVELAKERIAVMQVKEERTIMCRAKLFHMHGKSPFSPSACLRRQLLILGHIQHISKKRWPPAVRLDKRARLSVRRITKSRNTYE